MNGKKKQTMRNVNEIWLTICSERRRRRRLEGEGEMLVPDPFGW
jgi:hypothetical protein